MPHDLSPDTLNRIARHCRKAARIHRLAPAARDAMECRMREKILALLHGEEKLDESSAFTLARERFGDPSQIRELLGEVHVPDAAALLLRRVLGLFLLLQVTSVVLNLAFGALTLLVRQFAPGFIPGNTLGARLGSSRWLLDWYTLGSSILQLTVAILVLPRWQATLRAGGRPWLTRWPLRRMLAWLAVTMLLMPVARLIPKLLLSMSSTIQPDAANALLLQGHSHRIFTATQTVDTLRGAAFAILFIWWFDLRLPRNKDMLLSCMFKINIAAAFFFTLRALADLPGMIVRFDVYPASRYAADHLTGRYFHFNGCFFQWSPNLSFLPIMICFLVLTTFILWKALPKMLSTMDKRLEE